MKKATVLSTRYPITPALSSNDNKNNKLNKKVLLSAIIGNGLEFYDFALFGAFSVTFSRLFFGEDSFSALVNTLALFALAFFV
ncbi:MAG TPA: hypothetical protein DEP85_04000, partial [Holosporales bacterium]|nr:hypothetical protein [Holosporales bacterium]